MALQNFNTLNEPSRVFLNRKFILFNFPEEDVCILEETIKEMSGDVLCTYSNALVDYIVVPAFSDGISFDLTKVKLLIILLFHL